MKEIIDAKSMNRSLIRMAHEIVEKNKGAENLVLIGIKTRGEYLAKRLAMQISLFEDTEVPYGALDISYWRDDLKEKPESIHALELQVENKIVILVDDVLFSGRTIRAAMDGIFHFGRAKEIHLAVLVDRGHRELPIRADYVGKNVPTSISETIAVQLEEVDGKDGVYIY
ncbi:MAG: bifunctional pyr operon transcriptional regulator/uracil phosphoribosyltransferase PyrR [Erysipelotrichaceae bacterium]|nr:bifunctional pyr operon transcriptional regulator/uracil phosphoribosyltransferase PyrR [Erysipelotrichaceae bacterium]